MKIYKNYDWVNRDYEEVFTVGKHGRTYEEFEYFLPEGFKTFEGKCGDILVEVPTGEVYILENISGYPAITYYDNGKYVTVFMERDFDFYVGLNAYKTVAEAVKMKTISDDIDTEMVWENDAGEWDWEDMIICTLEYDRDYPYIYIDSQNRIISPDGKILFTVMEKQEGLFI